MTSFQSRSPIVPSGKRTSSGAPRSARCSWCRLAVRYPQWNPLVPASVNERAISLDTG